MDYRYYIAELARKPHAACLVVPEPVAALGEHAGDWRQSTARARVTRRFFAAAQAMGMATWSCKRGALGSTGALVLSPFEMG